MRDRTVSSRIIGVSTALALTAGLGIAAVVAPSSADPIGDPSSLARRTLGPNLIDNGGFSRGFTSWATDRQTAVRIASGGVWGSRKSVALEAPTPGAVTLRDARATAPTSASRAQYQVSAWVRATGARVDGILRLQEWQGANVVSATGRRFVARTDHWRQVTFATWAERSQSTLQVSLTAFGVSAGKGVKVDRVRLHPVKGTASPTVSPTSSVEPQPTASPTSSPEPTATPTPSPTPTPTPTSTAPVPVGETLFGASVDQEGRSWNQALADSNAAYGGMEVVRVFYPGLPSAWPGRAGSVDGAVVVSFKAKPADVLAGKHDAYLSQWFQSAPRDREIWWSYFHEPEDNVESGDFTAQQWRDAYRRIAALADAAQNPRLHSTVILMCWTISPKSSRTFSSYFPGADVVDTLGWDCYAHSTSPYSDPEDMYGKALAKTRELGLQFGVAETGAKLGSDDATGSKRGAWLRTVGRWLLDRDAAWACYWDATASGGDYRLTDDPSKQAWRDVVTTYGGHDPV